LEARGVHPDEPEVGAPTFLPMDQESTMTLLPNQALLETWESDVEPDPFLITLVCVAQWADRCAIWSLLGGGVGYEGELPADAATREELLVRAWNEVATWLDHEYPGYRLIAATLSAGTGNYWITTMPRGLVIRRSISPPVRSRLCGSAGDDTAFPPICT
jgi:hypothetical protein